MNQHSGVHRSSTVAPDQIISTKASERTLQKTDNWIHGRCYTNSSSSSSSSAGLMPHQLCRAA